MSFHFVLSNLTTIYIQTEFLINPKAVNTKIKQLIIYACIPIPALLT